VCQISRYVECLSFQELVALTQIFEAVSTSQNQAEQRRLLSKFDHHLEKIELTCYEQLCAVELMQFIHRRLALLYIQNLISTVDDYK
jgi:hypothetical protein